jgi:hypothetical protein
MRSGVLTQILEALEQDLEYRLGVSVADPPFAVPTTAHSRASWWWQTVLLLCSPDAIALRHRSQQMTHSRASHLADVSR